jgi:hypothetical protein
LRPNPSIAFGKDSRATLFDGNPAGCGFAAAKPDAVRQVQGLPVEIVLIGDRDMFDLMLAQVARQTREVLTPVKIADDEYLGRIVTAEFIEIGQLIRMSQDR